MSQINAVRNFIRRQFRAAPVTTTLLAANVITFLTSFFLQRQLWSFLAYDSGSLLTRPWTILTYPLIGGFIIHILLLGYMFWWTGGELERAFGSREFGLFLAATTVLAALAWTAGAMYLNDSASLASTNVGLSGIGLPLSVVFISWCMLNPSATILVMLVLPVSARVLAYAELAILYFINGPIAGLFAIVAPVCAWWYVAKGRRLLRRRQFRWSGDNGAERRNNTRPWWQRFNPIARYQREKRRREFERLMKLSDPSHHDRDTIQ